MKRLVIIVLMYVAIGIVLNLISGTFDVALLFLWPIHMSISAAFYLGKMRVLF